MDKHRRYLNLATEISSWSKCISRSVGAILVKDDMVISTGYNGTFRGYINCIDGGCKRCSSNLSSGEELDICLCCHAESNAIIQAAYHGISTKGSSLYLTHSPCIYCTKEIINAGIVEVHYMEEYAESETVKNLFEHVGVSIKKYNKSIWEIDE